MVHVPSWDCSRMCSRMWYMPWAHYVFHLVLKVIQCKCWDLEIQGARWRSRDVGA